MIRMATKCTSVIACLLSVSVRFAASEPTVTSVSTFTAGISNITGINRTANNGHVNVYPQNLKISNNLASPDYGNVPQAETQSLSTTAHEFAKPNPFRTNGVQRMTPLIAPDPKYDPNYELAEDLYSTLDTVKSLVGMLLDSGEINVQSWKFKDGEPSPEYIPDLGALKPDTCYVVTEVRSNMGRKYFRIYYWVGKYAPGMDAADAASYAMRLSSEFNTRVNVRREADGKESRAFKTLLKLSETHVQPGDFLENLEELDENYGNRMFLISRAQDDALSFKEVDLALGLHYFYNISNHCLIFATQEIYVCCGMATIAEQKLGADELAAKIRERTGLSETVTIHRDKSVRELSPKQQRDLLQLVGKLNRIPGTTVKANQQLEIYQVQQEANGEFQIQAPIPLRTVLNPPKSYLLDSCSAAGVFVWMSQRSDIEVRMESARQAELYLKDKNYDNTTPITYVDNLDISPLVWSVRSVLTLIIPSKKSNNA